VCQIQASNRILLASASEDSTVRLWDPVTATSVSLIRLPSGSESVAAAGQGELVVGMDIGLLLIEVP
jgi:WD40 repeat protein